MTELTKLFSPISIGSMELKNRLVMSPMHTEFAEPDGSVSETLPNYLIARAKGGAGLITTDICSLDSL